MKKLNPLTVGDKLATSSKLDKLNPPGFVSKNNNIVPAPSNLPDKPNTKSFSVAPILIALTYESVALKDSGAESTLSSITPFPHAFSVIKPSKVTPYLVLTLTVWPFFNVLVVNVLFIDIGWAIIPSTENSKKSAPLFAVKVKGVPSQTGLSEGETTNVTAGGATNTEATTGTLIL